mmetsp:Transcript_65560/g.165192  ORF Transcript_65560/g.165192 Transcript_65560/m.165192 type:complete len:211 (-) Transcript_65560:74-706(-)
MRHFLAVSTCAQKQHSTWQFWDESPMLAGCVFKRSRAAYGWSCMMQHSLLQHFYQRFWRSIVGGAWALVEILSFACLSESCLPPWPKCHSGIRVVGTALHQLQWQKFSSIGCGSSNVWIGPFVDVEEESCWHLYLLFLALQSTVTVGRSLSGGVVRIGAGWVSDATSHAILLHGCHRSVGIWTLRAPGDPAAATLEEQEILCMCHLVWFR